MGGKSSKQTVGYKFYAGANLVLARYVAKILQIKIGDKLAFEGASSGGDIAIDKPLLFGTKAEGGVTGTFRFRKGDSLQDVDPYLVSRLGANISADIGVSSLTLAKPYLGNTPYVKEISIRAERVFELEDGVEQWYAEKAGIPVASSGLAGLSWSLPCTAMGTTTACACPLTSQMQTVYSSGTGETDNVEFRIRGVIELQSFAGGTSLGGYVYRGGTPQLEDVNDYYLEVSSPNHRYHLNSGVFSIEAPTAVDYTLTIPIDDGATLTLFATSADGAQIANTLNLSVSDDDFTRPIGVSQPYHGQFLQADPLSVIFTYDLNPAHIIREALLNTEWGYGYSEADIDDVNFRSVADALYNESFGLSYFWDDNSSLDTVINKVLDHIDGVLYLDRDSLKFKLALNRADYNVEELIELKANVEIARIENYKKPQFLDLYNTVTVKYYNTVNSGSGSFSHSNSALFLQQGMRKAIEIEYGMCCNPALALRLLQREIDKQTNPYSSCTVYANSAAKSLRRGSVFKLTALDYNYNQTVMRVTEIGYGDGKSKEIKISCVEDRFAMPSDSAVVIQQPEVETPPAPAALTNRMVIEEPYAMLVKRLGQSTVNDELATTPDAGYFGASAARNDGALTAFIYADAGSGFEEVGRLDFCPFGTLAADVGYLDNSISIENLIDSDEISNAVLFQIGNEIMSYTPPFGATLTGVKRGLFDTIPETHLAGAKVFFFEYWLDGATQQYVDGEIIDVKLLPTTSKGVLSLADAPADSFEFAGRAARPYPPANVKINGNYYPASISADVAVTWAHRDRLQQADQEIDYFEPNVGPEAGVEYTVRYYFDGVLAHTSAGIVGTSDTYTPVITANATLRVEVESLRSGLVSYRMFAHECDWLAPLTLTGELPDGTLGVAYSGSLTVEGGTAPYVWDVSSGSLPPGLSLNSATGEISGTPT